LAKSECSPEIGGDGRTTFGLQDLRGRIPIHQGQGPGLSSRALGLKAGTEHETITLAKLPPHVHVLKSNTQAGQEGSANNAVPAQATLSVYDRNPLAAATRSLAPASVSTVGGGQAHTNRQPYLCVHFIIALVGIYPSRQ
jgi:microcystin-dependent protein